MATMEKCYGCGVVFKHHELCAHRRAYKCGVEHPLRNQEVKESLRKEKRDRIDGKRLLRYNMADYPL